MKKKEKKLVANLGRFVDFVYKVSSYFYREYHKTQFIDFGSSSYLGHNCKGTFQTINVGDYTFIGSNCVLSSAHGKIEIGNHVMFGAGVHLHGGNHIIDRIGVFMKDVKKDVGSDGILYIADDVWIGSNAIVLGGGRDLKIGRGCVVAAGAIVTKSMPPYCVVVGAPAKPVKFKWNIAEIMQHEKALYEEKDRFTQKELEAIFIEAKSKWGIQ